MLGEFRGSAIELYADALEENERLRAEREDLAAKLAQAQTELHELRIAAGLGEAGERWEPVEDAAIHDGLVTLEVASKGSKFCALVDNDCAFVFYFRPDVRLCRKASPLTPAKTSDIL